MDKGRKEEKIKEEENQRGKIKLNELDYVKK